MIAGSEVGEWTSPVWGAGESKSVCPQGLLDRTWRTVTSCSDDLPGQKFLPATAKKEKKKWTREQGGWPGWQLKQQLLGRKSRRAAGAANLKSTGDADRVWTTGLDGTSLLRYCYVSL
jgi:hypothetical protein